MAHNRMAICPSRALNLPSAGSLYETMWSVNPAWYGHKLLLLPMSGCSSLLVEGLRFSSPQTSVLRCAQGESTVGA